MDDAEKAILYAFDETGATPPDLKARAEEYCRELKGMENSWQFFLQRVNETTHDSVAFWCLKAVQDNLQNNYVGMNMAQKIAVKTHLTSWLRRPQTSRGSNLAPFLRNKVAQLVVFVVQVEYPDQWPSFFHDLIAVLADGPDAVDMFCRVLVAVDQDVVSREISRSNEEVQRSSKLKDAMRDGCLEELLQACIQLTARLHSSNPQLTASVLEAVARYVNWIDISLVANDRLVPLLYSLLQSEEECLQAGALEVLTEIAAKRMDAEAKLRLLQQLGVVATAASWTRGLPGDALGEVPLKAARLLATLCSEVLDSWKKVENAVVSISSVGLSVDNEAIRDAQGAVDAAQAFICDLFPAVVATVRNEDEEVRLAPVPFLQSYANKLKASLKRINTLPEVQLQQIEPVFNAVAVCIEYPADAPSVLPAGFKDRQEWEETNQIMQERRQEFFVVFKNFSKLSLELTTKFVSQQLQAKVQPQTPFQEVEAAISLLFETGEAATDEMVQSNCGALGPLALGLMQVEVPHASHRLVSLGLAELYVRFNKVAAQNPQALHKVLAFFLSNNGISHADAAVGTRACYLFCRLVKAVRSSLHPLLADLLTVLQPHLDRIATSPMPEPPNATKSVPGSWSSTDDRLYAHEAAGLLVGGEDLAPEQQLTCLSALMQPLLAQIEQYLPGVKEGGPISNGTTSSKGEKLPVNMVLQALEGLNRLTKGLTLQICTVKRPAVGERLAVLLQASLSILQAAPNNRALRLRVISFLHRLVECLGPHLLPQLPQVLTAVMPPDTDRTDLQDSFTLVHQLVTRYKAALRPLLLPVLPEIVRRVSTLLPSDWGWTGPTLKSQENGSVLAVGEESREMAELQKAFFILLHAICANELTGVVIAMDSSLLDLLLQALLATASSHSEAAIRRACFQVLKQIVAEVGKGGATPPPAYQQFILQLAGPVALQSVLSSGMDTRDAAVNSLLQDVAALLQLLAKQGGEMLSQHLTGTTLPALALPMQLQEELLKGIGGSDTKALKATLKSILQQAANAPPGSKSRWNNKKPS